MQICSARGLQCQMISSEAALLRQSLSQEKAKDRRKKEERATDVAQVGARHLNGGLLFHISPVT